MKKYLPATVYVHPFVADPSEDLELFLALQAGTTAALGRLYDLYGNRMYALAFKILNNRQEAEDLVQEIFLSVWRHCTYQPEQGSFKTFLMVLTRSRSLDRLRSQTTRLNTLQQSKRTYLEENINAPFEQAASDEVSQRVRAALETLPDQQQQALRMAYFEGLTQAEIAQTFQVPLGTVKSWFRLGFKKLRLLLKDLINLDQNV